MLRNMTMRRVLLHHIGMVRIDGLAPLHERGEKNTRQMSRAWLFSEDQARFRLRASRFIRTIRGEFESSYISDTARMQLFAK